MSKYNIKSELKQKQRYVSDLIRFIRTRNDKNPNYSLLLGSGCSITSGIKSGGELIKTWRKEIFLELISHDEKYEKKFCSDNELHLEAIKYLSEKHASWYNISNEYSSLFEKKYDLASQRRMFVEEEVRDKIPSIGYAYLIKLIEQTYINTIFTTNFDDLVNEAFYQYSEIRPIVCAHDSSINSITVTSKRPKIIKLHGDYLFDDIKSTLKETETLENNIKNKFIEFAKDYGLIVVGYGGHDRSIMDVLNYLLKHEDYYKNGIYWCIRKGDEISEDLKKLLWKDRVYFVEIDGFDELFAEIHNQIYNGKLPIDTKFVANKSQEIIKNFIDNKFLNSSNSNIILDDLSRLKKQSEQNSLFEIIKSMQEEKGFGNDELTDKEVIKLLELNNLYTHDNLKSAVEIIKSELDLTHNKHYKIELLKKQFSSYVNLNLYNEAFLVVDQLIDIEPKNPIHLIKKSNIENTYEKRLKLIEDAIELDKYSEELLNKKLILLTKKYDDYKKNEIEREEILKTIEKSLELNPSITNEAWEIKFDFLFEENKTNKELNEIIICLEKQKPYSLVLLNMKYELLKENTEKLNFIKTLNNAKNLYINNDNLDYELFYFKILADVNEKDLINDKLLELDNSNYNKNELYLFNKSIIIFEKFKKLDESIDILKKLLENDKKSRIVDRLITYLLYDDQLEEARKIFDEYKYLLSRKNVILNNIKFYDYEKDYTHTYLEVKKLQELEIYDKNMYISKVCYYLILQDKIDEAKDILSEYLKSKNFCKKLVVEIINYEFLCKVSNPRYKVDKSRLEPIKSSTNDMMIKAVISILEDKKNDAYKFIKEGLERDYSNKFETVDWPIFNYIRDEQKFKELFDLV